MNELSTKTTLLELLALGCTIIFPNDYMLKADTQTQEIDCSPYCNTEATKPLNENGLSEALELVKKSNPAK